MEKKNNLQKVFKELQSILSKYERFDVEIYIKDFDYHIRIYSVDEVLFTTPTLKEVMKVITKYKRDIVIIDNYAQIF